MPDDKILSVTCYIAAPPARVWEVMTGRQQEWWCPTPWRAEIIEQDWRAGGRCAMLFKGPDGEEMPQDGLFLEVTPGVRFVTTDACLLDDQGRYVPGEPFMIGCWEIAPEGEGTRYTASARHWTDEARQTHADMGFVEGWQACAAQLAALCEQ